MNGIGVIEDDDKLFKDHKTNNGYVNGKGCGLVNMNGKIYYDARCKMNSNSDKFNAAATIITMTLNMNNKIQICALN